MEAEGVGGRGQKVLIMSSCTSTFMNNKNLSVFRKFIGFLYLMQLMHWLGMNMLVNFLLNIYYNYGNTIKQCTD